jgi:hypothetical protein
MDCDCRIAHSPPDGDPYTAYCPLHKAAPQLVEALEANLLRMKQVRKMEMGGDWKLRRTVLAEGIEATEAALKLVKEKP